MSENNKKDIFIEGAGIYLRPPTDLDLEGNWYRWFNDAEVTRFEDKGYFANSIDKQTSYFENISQSNTDVVLAIIHNQSNKHIGNVGLHRINWIHRTAILGIVIGEKEFWGKGYGKQSWKLITQYGIEVLNLNKITATMIEGNSRSLACALASGFDIEGTQKEQMYKHGEYHNLIQVGITKKIWLSGKDNL
tara:strand:- start:96 stop:668 length:573 start_codon:yes stop_codon:yes gene_type:complete